MLRSVATLYIVLCLTLTGLVKTHETDPLHVKHVAHRSASQIQKRYRATNFVTGLGACGNWNVASDFIIALNIPQFANGAHCGQTVTIKYKGKTAQAQVQDECVKCPWGAIDLTDGLFVYLAGSLDPGVLDVDWYFNDEAPAPPKSTTEKPKPTTTTTTTTKTKTTSTASTSPTKATATPTDTKSKGTSTSTSTSTSSTSSEVTSTISVPPVATPNNIADIRSLIIGLGGLVLTGL